jgi:threonine dehydrogenase-like Zn-dependent dehydrogenase
MRALWLEAQQLTLRDDLPRPQPPPGEALVRVLRAGICNTDLELTRGYYPFRGVLGHEFVGVVESGGPWQGRRVCGEINAACGRCGPCRRGDVTHCDQRTVLGIVNRDGAFAQYLTLPEQNLHAVPDAVPDDEAVFTEPLAAALEILEQVHLRPTDTAAVVGDGKLGQLCAQVLALTGCRVLALGRHPGKLEVLRARGVQTALVSEAPNWRVDVAVECTGQAAGFEAARRLVRPRGTLVLKSTYAGALTLDMSQVVVDELSLVGSRCGPFEPGLELLARRAVDVQPLIHARYPLQDGLRAFEHAQRPGTLKVLLEVS